MVNDTPNVNTKHKSCGHHQPIRDQLTSEVQVNTGVENVAKTQKS